MNSGPSNDPIPTITKARMLSREKDPLDQDHVDKNAEVDSDHERVMKEGRSSPETMAFISV